MKGMASVLICICLLLSVSTAVYGDGEGNIRILNSEIETETKKLESDSKKAVKVKKPLAKHTILSSWDKIDNWGTKLGEYQQTYSEHPELEEVLNNYALYQEKFNEILAVTNSLALIDEIAASTVMAPEGADKPELIALAKELLDGKQGEIIYMYVVKDIFNQASNGWESDGSYYALEWDEFHVASIELIDNIKWYRYYQFQKTTKSAQGIKKPDWRYAARLTSRPILDENIIIH
ncbi:MAG: hypothetical protein JW996_00665 [Candidatus Cloacimonetes bacterium]|nr:hypothetical protein [Candidatus Cloacimonadota bacterium]